LPLPVTNILVKARSTLRGKYCTELYPGGLQHILWFRIIITMMADGMPRGPGLRIGGDEVCWVRSELSLFIGSLLEKVGRVY
jgi:hypothetical protein